VADDGLFPAHEEVLADLLKTIRKIGLARESSPNCL